MSVTYTAVLPVREETVNRLAGLLDAERTRRGTRAGTRSLPCRDQAILTLRWFYDGTRIKQLAADNKISVSTGYDYLDDMQARRDLPVVQDALPRKSGDPDDGLAERPEGK